MVDEQAGGSLFLAPRPPPAPGRGQASTDSSGSLSEVEGGRRRWLAVIVVVALLVAGVVANRRNAQLPVSDPSGGGTAVDEEDGEDDEEEEEEAGARPPPALAASSLRTLDRLATSLPAPTGTTLVLAASTQVVVFEVDSGTLRNVQIAKLTASSSHPWGSQVHATDDAIVVRGRPPRAVLVPREDGAPVRPVELGSGGGLYPSDVPGRFWVEEVRGDGVLQELDVDGAVSRVVPMVRPLRSVVWDGLGFVQSTDEAALATPPDGSAPTVVAPGIAVAADRATVALAHCGDGGTTCSLELFERATGVGRAVAAPDGSDGFVLEGGATFSPNGRWLLVTSAPGPARLATKPAGLAVVDVAAGAVAFVEPAEEGGPAATGAFSTDGRWLFLASTTSTVEAQLHAVDLTTGDRSLLATVPLRAGFGITLAAFPSVPADLGAGS